MRLGEGYEVRFNAPSNYTFCGMPGAMIKYDDKPFGFDASPDTGDAQNLSVSVFGHGNVTLIWQIPEDTNENVTYRVHRSDRRDGFWGNIGVDYKEIDMSEVSIQGAWIIVTDPGIALPGTEHYYMIVPVDNTTGKRGVTSYSIGVWVEYYMSEYDTIGIPLKMGGDHTAQWFCDNIPYTVGINYYDIGAQRWMWHSKNMPRGAFDTQVEMTVGYQISTQLTTKFTFIGI
jgi:hypothetical protein